MASRTAVWRGGWLAGLSWTYVAGIGLWLALRELAGDRFWWLALLNTDALLLFLPWLPLLLLTLWRRRLTLLAGLALPLAGFAALYSPVLLPPLPLPPPAGPVITVMTFNVLHTTREHTRLIAAIRAVDADLVGLQELRASHWQAIEAELAASYPVRLRHPTDPSVGLLSRLPVESLVPLADPPLPRALLVRLRADDRRLSVISAHLTPTNMLDNGLTRLPATVDERYASRTAQVAGLLAAVQAEAQPTIILCDCNLTDTSAAYAQLRAGLTDSFAEAGWGLRRTMLATDLGWPAQRLDYIWATAELQPIDALVGPDGGSDHLPAVARLAWR